MTTTLRVILALAIWLLYSLVAYLGCIKPSCCSGLEEEALTEEQPFDVLQLGPVISNWSLPAVDANEGYEAWRQNLVAQSRERAGEFLEIYGYYYEGEPKPEGFANMGFARAEAIKQLLGPDIAADRIRIRARAGLDVPEDIQERPFDALAELKWVAPEKKEDASVNIISEGDRVDRVIFLFALNATIQEDNPEIMAELKKMAADIIENKRTVSVVGHADNSGTAEYNYDLGLTRANTIKGVLEKLGVPSAQIRVESKGETQPTDANDTEAGRRNNRRVEVRIVN